MRGLLADCYTRDRSLSEVIILQEGVTAEQAKRLRDRETQAILPITPGIVDARSASVDEVLDSFDVISIIAAVGVFEIPGEIASQMNLLRYNEVYVVADETRAGIHFRETLLAFIRIYMSPLLTAEKVSLLTVQRLEEMSDEEFLERVLSRETRETMLVKT